MGIAIGNPWDVAPSAAFRSLSGSSAEHLSRKYSKRNYSDRFREKHESLSSLVRASSVYRNAIGALRKLKNGRGSNTVRRLITIGELQHAPVVMHGALTANPLVRRAYNNRMIEGYSETFAKTDRWRGRAYKHSDINYCMVMDQAPDIETGTCWSYALSKFERETFTVYERSDIQLSWKEQLRLMRESDDDFTSPINAARGM